MSPYVYRGTNTPPRKQRKPNPTPNKRKCTLPDCNQPHKARGLCEPHYKHNHRKNPPPPKRTCTHPGCNKPHEAHGHCTTHYKRIYRAQQRNDV